MVAGHCDDWQRPWRTRLNEAVVAILLGTCLGAVIESSEVSLTGFSETDSAPADLGAEDRDENKRLSQVRAGRQIALQRSQRLSHLTGANWFFVSLARHARRGGGALRRWPSESHAAEFFYERMTSLSALASLPQPDGLGSWAEDGREIVFMLEYDTGSERLAQLVRKLDSYARLAEVMSR
jgi:hypothetical protein